MPDIVMPKLSDSMDEGTILSWLKAAGDDVAVGEDLLEIETDKATVTYAAEAAGMLEILVGEGATVAAGETIARVGTGTVESPTGPRESEPRTAASSETTIGSSAVELTAEDASPVTGSGSGSGTHMVAATPLARRAAAIHGVPLEAIEGTGPLGRITRSDVLGHVGLEMGATPSLPAMRHPAPPPTSQRVEPSRLQRLIARRLAEAKRTVPHFQVQTEVAMDKAIALRAELKAVTAEDDAVPSLNDIALKAAAIALREHPLANGSYQDDGFVLHGQVNVGMAVAADDALVVPTVFDADIKSLRKIARETRALAPRVRSGAISPAELEGATFTVSNLGMFGVTAITPVINPPQAAILGLGATRAALARVDGQIVDRTLLTLTLSCDHRILYGAEAALFLGRIRELLETPLKLLITEES